MEGWMKGALVVGGGFLVYKVLAQRTSPGGTTVNGIAGQPKPTTAPGSSMDWGSIASGIGSAVGSLANLIGASGKSAGSNTTTSGTPPDSTGGSTSGLIVPDVTLTPVDQSWSMASTSGGGWSGSSGGMDTAPASFTKDSDLKLSDPNCLFGGC